MSPLMKYYVCKRCRLIVFALRRDGKYYNLLSIIEVFPDGMDPDREFITSSGKEYIDCIKNVDSKADKVFFGVQYTTITQDMLERPQECLNLGETKIYNLTDGFLEEESEWIQILNTSKEHVDLLPQRDTSCRVKIFNSHCIIDKLGDEKSKTKIFEQLKKLSERNLSIDILKYVHFLGCYFVVQYTPVFRNIHIRTNPNNDEVICRIIYRTSNHPSLNIDVRAYGSEGKEVAKIDETKNGIFLKGFKFSRPFHQLDLEVRDSDGELIDKYSQISFLKSISLDMGIKTKDVNYILREVDEQGNEIKRKEKTVEKFVHEKSIVFGKENKPIKKEDSHKINSLFDSSPEYTYKKFEDSLDFVFFDGDKNKINENKARAKECVMRILNSAEKTCYICDIFFTEATFFEFLTEIKSLQPEIRIISSKEKLKEKNIKALADMIKQSNKEVRHKIECRLMKGDKAALHDRIIIADDKVWMLGCSLNEFGQRATTLIRVPREYAPRIIQEVKQWWNDDSKTEPIDDK